MKTQRAVTAKRRRKTTRKRGSLYAKIDWQKAEALFQRPSPKRETSSDYPSTREILRVLAGVGAVGMMFLFPGAAPGLGMLLLGGRSYSRWRTKQILSQLAKQKFVAIKEHDNGKVTVAITQQGMVRALTYELDSMHLVKPKTWDKKWRVVIFDIPEKYKRVRDVFRMRLRQLGLHQFQESVYVSPYPCFDEVEFLRELYDVAFTVRYLLVEKLEDDSFLKNHFDLKA